MCCIVVATTQQIFEFYASTTMADQQRGEARGGGDVEGQEGGAMTSYAYFYVEIPTGAG